MLLLSSCVPLMLSPSEESRDVVDRLTASPKSWASVRSALSILRSEYDCSVSAGAAWVGGSSSDMMADYIM